MIFLRSCISEPAVPRLRSIGGRMSESLIGYQR